MTKAWCIWCEKGEIPKHGYYWVHQDCFFQFSAMHSRIEKIEQYLKGELPRIKANGNQLGYDSVEAFITSMLEFDRKWRNLESLLETRKRTP